MTTPNARKHQVPTGTETPSRGALLAMLLQVNDIVPATSATDRNNLLAAIGSSAARPLHVYRTDIDALEVHDGTSWKIIQAMDSPGIQRGVISATLTSQATRVGTATFPTPYPSGVVPIMSPGLVKAGTGNIGLTASFNDVTNTGFGWRVNEITGTAVSVGLGLHWTAIAPT